VCQLGEGRAARLEELLQVGNNVPGVNVSTLKIFLPKNYVGEKNLAILTQITTTYLGSYFAIYQK
jgi:hypothetical protein